MLGRKSRLIVLKTLAFVLYGFLLLESCVRLSAFMLHRKSSVPSPSEGTHSIYCVGDSFTYGVGVEQREAWPSLLHDLLRQNHIGKYEVLNMGIPGRSSSYALYMTAKIIESPDPKTLIILTGWNANNNDFLTWRELTSKKASLLSRINVLLEHSKSYCLFKWLITYRTHVIKTDDVQLIPMTTEMDLYTFKAYQEICLHNLGKIAKMCKDNGVPLLLLNYPYRKLPRNKYGLEYEYYHLLFGRTPLSGDDYIIPEKHQNEIAIHSVIRHIAERRQLDYLDLHSYFHKGDPDKLFQKDFHHPTRLGHKIIAEAVYRRLCLK